MAQTPTRRSSSLPGPAGPTDLPAPDLRHLPSLQGAEVLAFSLLRGPAASDHQACAVMTLALPDPAPAPADPDVAPPGRRQTVLEIRFDGLESVLVADFDHRNEIADLVVVRLDRLGKLKVVIEPRSGFGGSWVCRAATLVSMTTRADKPP